MAISSNILTFIDTTDTKKIDAHIISNHPTMQIFDTNKRTYTPNWDPSITIDNVAGVPLKLSVKVLADSINVTHLSTYQWFKDNKPLLGSDGKAITTSELTISSNMADDIVEYTCKVKYNNKDYDAIIVLTRVTTGKDGVDGKPGKNGEDGAPGKSVGIKGIAYTRDVFSAGAKVTLFSDPEYKNQITTGYTGEDTVDGYLVDGYLCVYAGEYFIWTGKIQGPPGQKGESTYLFTRYADDQNGTGFSDSPIGKKYIGFYRTSETTLSSNIDTGYSTWVWTKYVGENATSFQLYAPKGYLITYDVPEVTLEAFAYDGSQLITSATFVWYSWNGQIWNPINSTTNTSLTLNKFNVLKSNVYKCEMTYKDKVYEATATVEDKTDIYESLIRVMAKQSSANRMYWILYTTVYSEDGEHDSLLGPISEIEPIDPVIGDYWYKIDESNYTVTLMKYSGSEWHTTTDTQELLYDWTLFKDASDIVTLGTQNKVKIVTANDFSRVCNVQCNIFNSDYILFARNSQVLNDPSDPIVSTTEPLNPIDKQLWIKIADNGTYIISIWDEATKKWMVSDADSQNRVFADKPVRYIAGDIWIVGGDYQPTIYTNGVATDTKYAIGTMLKAQSVSATYSDGDWVEALNYKENIDDLKGQLNTYNQYFSFDEDGIIMTAKSSSGEISEFKTKLTNTELGFYQGENKVAYINDNQLNISKAEITNGLKVTGTQNTPAILSIGGFSLVVESNGSLSIGYNA